MVGAIGTWDILAHPVVTIRCFGWRVFFRAIVAGGDQTFLSVLRQSRIFATPSPAALPPAAPPLLDRCVQLEIQAMRIYDYLAERMIGNPRVSRFLMDLAEQEESHAELLEICRVAVGPRWRDRDLAACEKYLPILEQQMATIVAGVDRIYSADDALALVVQIEASEVNRLFLTVLRAADSPFVARLAAFRQAAEEHIRYICQQVPDLAPSAMLACRELRAKYLASPPSPPA